MPEDKNSAFVQDSDKLKSKLQPVPKPQPEIGIDSNDTLLNDLASVQVEQVNLSRLESFTTISQKRDQLYQLLDSMASDSMVSAILKVFTEDSTERAIDGRIVWAQSNNENAAKYVNFLLDSLNVDKYVYRWMYSLCKYGDLYLKLYRESEVEDPIFKDAKSTTLNESVESDLDESVKIKAYKKSDKYVFYMEAIPNPAEIFELTKFGKTYGYIEAPVRATSTYDSFDNNSSYYNTSTFKYRFKKQDVNIYAPTEFVHACLSDDADRNPEEVNIFLNDEDYDSDTNSYSYKVRRGESLLYPAFKIWRQLMLLENSILLNRLTKSSLVRIIGVEVGDMPKEKVGATLAQLKSMIEQKSAINESINMAEYTNTGSYENNVYVPIRNNQGTITTTEIGSTGETGSGNLSDLDYFKNKFYGVFGIPKAYLGDTDDAAGFDGGKSLALLSSRYAKTVKRLQQTMIQALTDAVNLFLIDKGLQSYINDFQIHMLAPSTQEELDKKEAINGQIDLIGNIQNLLSDVEEPIAKLKCLKALLTGVIPGDELLPILQEEIDRMQAAKDLEKEEENAEEGLDTGESDMNLELPEDEDIGPSSFDDIGEPGGNAGPEEVSNELPSMEDIGVDFADSNNF